MNVLRSPKRIGLLTATLVILAAVAWAKQPAEPPFSERLKVQPFPEGLTWINTAGPLQLADLRGKFVLLDFWTLGCINCMHILPELKKLEEAYPNELVVIGVHSAKFDQERTPRTSPRRCSATASSTRWSTMPTSPSGTASACRRGRRSS